MIKDLRLKNNKKFNRESKGFTLIELLVVIAIIGVLAGLLVANFVGVRQRARDGVRKSDVQQIRSALELYRSDQGRYPTAPLPGCGNNPLTDPGNTITYMGKIPCDPLSPPPTIYRYRINPTNTKYCIRACLENINDTQRDEIIWGSNNPPDIQTGCTYTFPVDVCTDPTRRSYTVQSP